MPELSVYCDVLDEPARAAALSHLLLDEARARSAPILCAYALPGDVLALGRYHVIPPAVPRGDVRLLRRLGGGRPAPLGDGYVGLVLALPHRAALIGEDPAALAPEQVLNRAVRGLLGALQSLGVNGYYPGRDRVTVDGRVVAALGFEVASDGATLVEACVAVARSFAEVSAFADRADPGGVVPIDLLLPEEGTCIAESGTRAPDLDEFTAALAVGYAERLGLDVAMSEGVRAPSPNPGWLEAGRLAPHLDRHASARDMLGVIEVYAARAGDHVGDVRLCGDLIAASGTVARLEAALRDAPIDRVELCRRAAAAVEERGDVLLGVRSVATIGELVYTACAA